MDQKIIANLLHPVRMNIMQVITANGPCSARQLSQHLPDIAQASLYRHLRGMHKDQILEIFSETQVRGTLERSFNIKRNPLREVDEKGESLPNAQLINLFFSFMISQLTDCMEYLGPEGSTMEPERFGFRTWIMHLKDEDLTEFIQDFRALFERYSKIENSPGARLHKFSYSLFPARKNTGEGSE